MVDRRELSLTALLNPVDGRIWCDRVCQLDLRQIAYSLFVNYEILNH